MVVAVAVEAMAVAAGMAVGGGGVTEARWAGVVAVWASVGWVVGAVVAAAAAEAPAQTTWLP